MNGRYEIESRLQEIAEVCRTHGVARLEVFGSVLRNDFNDGQSDIDLLVEFLPGMVRGWSGDLCELEEDMVRLFGRPVDLIPLHGVKNPLRLEEIESGKELLYAA